MNSKRTKYSGITSAGSNIAHILQRDGGTRSVGIHGTRTVRVQKRREFCNDITQVMSNHWGVGVWARVYIGVWARVCVCVCVCVYIYMHMVGYHIANLEFALTWPHTLSMSG